MTIEPSPAVGAIATRRWDTKPPDPVENLNPPLNAATRRRRSEPTTAGPQRHPEPPGSTVPACSTSPTRLWSKDSRPTPDAERAIQAAVRPSIRTAGTKCVGPVPSATASSRGYDGGLGRGGAGGLAGTVAGWATEPVVDDAVGETTVIVAAARVLAAPPPPQPAIASAAAPAAVSATTRCLTCRLTRATAPA